MWKKTDKIYTDFYETNKRIVIIYFFSFLIIALDLFALFIALSINEVFKISSNGHAWYLFSPFIFEWVVSIVMLIVYRCRVKEVKRKVMNIVLENKNKIKNPSKENLKAICKKLRLRTKYCKHNVFENCVQGIIIFFVPVFLKITVFKDSTYHTIFLTASSLFYGSLFVTNMIKILRKKCKKSKQYECNNIDYFKKKYPLNPKVIEIAKTIEKYKSTLSETALNFLFFIGKLLIGFLFIVYFSEIGGKIDDPVNGNSWITLFIPFYIMFVPLIGYTILHLCSLVTLFKGKMWFVALSIIPCTLSFITNSILIPLRMENRIGISAYWFPGLFTVGTVFLALHMFIVSRKVED